jgi:hypothetical protein
MDTAVCGSVVAGVNISPSTLGEMAVSETQFTAVSTAPSKYEAFLNIEHSMEYGADSRTLVIAAHELGSGSSARSFWMVCSSDIRACVVVWLSHRC